MKSILTIVKYNLIIDLIYISLIISDIEHLLIFHWPLVCLFKKCLVGSSAQIFYFAFDVKLYKFFVYFGHYYVSTRHIRIHMKEVVLESEV